MSFKIGEFSFVVPISGIDQHNFNLKNYPKYMKSKNKTLMMKMELMSLLGIGDLYLKLKYS